MTGDIREAMCRVIAQLDDDEILLLDGFFTHLMGQRSSWAKHTTDRLWHSVLTYADGSVQTRCCGRWALTEPYDTASRPPLGMRCEACQDAFVERNIIGDMLTAADAQSVESVGNGPGKPRPWSKADASVDAPVHADLSVLPVTLAEPALSLPAHLADSPHPQDVTSDPETDRKGEAGALSPEFVVGADSPPNGSTFHEPGTYLDDAPMECISCGRISSHCHPCKCEAP